MQRAAITAARNNGESFEQIKKQYPDLKKVAERMENEEQSKQVPRRAASGPITMMDRPVRAPR